MSGSLQYYKTLHQTGAFAINLTTEKLARATDYCGVVSGSSHDKWKECHLTKEEAKEIPVSLVATCYTPLYP